MTKSFTALTLYVLMVASRWVLEAGLPSALPGLEEQCLVLLLVLVIAVVPRPQGVTRHYMRDWRMVSVGLLLFGFPAALLVAGGRPLPVLTRTALMTLVPVALVLLSASHDFLELLGASLSGVAGCMLLLPVDAQSLLRRPASVAALVATLAFVSVGSTLAFRLMRYMPLRAALVLLCAPSLLLLVFVALSDRATLVIPHPADVAVIVWDVLEVLLLAYLLRTVSPLTLGARFLVVPLVTTIEGFAVVRPGVTWRLVMGVALLAFGSWRLLRHDGTARDSSLSLL